MLSRLRLLPLTIALLGASAAIAHETDQFTTPSGREFADLGPFFNQWAYDLIDAGVASANARIARELAEGDPKKISAAQDSGTLVNAVHAQLPWSVDQIESWEWLLMSDEMRHRYPGQLVSFREIDHNIYEHAFSPLDLRICSRWYFASTIKVYGTYLGTDKIGHFTDMGASYYWAWRAARDAGAPEARATAAAVRLGTDGLFSESGLLGTLSNGDYSNGDLAANFAGFLFYRNLGEWTSIKGRPRPPLVIKDGAFWKIADHVRRDSDFFSLFISDHLDEALNPGLFDPSMRPALREAVRRNRSAILWRYRASDGTPRPRSHFQALLYDLKTYWGCDYGHRGNPGDLVSIAGCCFPPDRSIALARQPNRASMLVTEGAIAATHHETVAVVAGSDATWQCDSAKSMQMSLSIAQGGSIEKADDFGRTPLHDAAAAGSDDAIRVLLGRGAAVNVKDQYGNTPLHLACRGGHVAAASILLQAGAEVRAISHVGTTPLHEAAFSGERRLIEILLAAGALPSARDRLGRAPRDIAAARHQRNAMILLPVSSEQ